MGISGEGFQHSRLANSRVIPYNKIRWINEIRNSMKYDSGEAVYHGHDTC
ncbi:hypothetical protein RUMLAC_01657 [[Ruminococcus] lactaris ATCC 29176]|uniref:Uncharacterized protein n=1 Tax=[Ruminococcus] lactaris ATCC 29176 TaxID=471875 RepID=B5CQB2_9FIRM|nr:hypothetical protein RUMLAC_01657 [[Ruminococcus] lactaris ATCC 29176]